MLFSGERDRSILRSSKSEGGRGRFRRRPAGGVFFTLSIDFSSPRLFSIKVSCLFFVTCGMFLGTYAVI
jgi:hypothetical protein